MFLYLFVFKHVYFWLPYASAAVGNSIANSVIGLARYFCGDRTFLHMRYMHIQTVYGLQKQIRISIQSIALSNIPYVPIVPSPMGW